MNREPLGDYIQSLTCSQILLSFSVRGTSPDEEETMPKKASGKSHRKGISLMHVVAGLVGRRLLYRDLVADNGRSRVAG